MKKSLTICLILISALILVSALPLQARDIARLSKGQMIYVPAYSHIYSGNKELPSLLAVTLSIRNTDPAYPITIHTVDYYETQGLRLKGFISSPLVLNPLESFRYIIPEKDKAGGSGANFIVEWKAGRPVNPPIVETIMVGPRTSFTSRGQEIFPSD
ncbi:DUF3124 domain-containing protein [Desulfospira joergensenii]|uniref:DUF3124 domain-containing protein n=1 Tax=Desulfospira joergensenii TaxID=53329 RepID=UPI0003B74C30|nr:DUF3124 domain-containing protein [Desulfospira joergensenii]